MKHLGNVVDGFSSLFDFDREPYQKMNSQPFCVPRRGEGFAQDAKNLSSDWRMVARDMNSAVKAVKKTYRTE